LILGPLWAKLTLKEIGMELIDRVRGLLFVPRFAWANIARDPVDPTAVFTYVAILAAIPAVARFIGGSLIGWYTPILSGLLAALVNYLLAFAAVYAVALGINAMAPAFGAARSFPGALKLAAYSYTPLWLAGIFLLIPGLTFLTILSLYGIYLLWTGLPIVMEVPSDRALPYAIAILVCALAVALVMFAIQGAIFGLH
jgi:hypothetical protein